MSEPSIKPPIEKPVPPPTNIEEQKDDLFTTITTVVEGMLPTLGKETKGLKKLVDGLRSAIQSAGADQVKQVKEELQKAIVSIQNKEGTVEDLFIKKLDDWAEMLNADPLVIKGLKVLAREETMDFLRKLMKGWKDFQKGETHITMHYRTFVVGWLSTIIATAFVFTWIGTMI